MRYLQELEKKILLTEADPDQWKPFLTYLLEQFQPVLQKTFICMHSKDPGYHGFCGAQVEIGSDVASLDDSGYEYHVICNGVKETKIGELLVCNNENKTNSIILACRLSETLIEGEFYAIGFQLDERTARQEIIRIQQDLQEMLRVLLPTILKVIAGYLSNRVNLRKNFLMTDMLDRVGSPAMFLNCNGAVLYANREARLEVSNQEGNVYVSANNILCFRSNDKRNSISEVLSEVYENVNTYDTVVRLASDNVVYNDIMLIRRLGSSTKSTPWKQLFCGSPSAMAIIRKGAGKINLSPELIREGMGFTKRESQLASSLVNGHSLSEYSSHVGIKKETTRWHMKQIQQKTGASGQIDLVRRVLYQFSLYGMF